MSILDKPLIPPPRRSRRRPFFIVGTILVLLIVLFLFTDVRADMAFIVHFVSAPMHYTYGGHSDHVSAVAWSPDGSASPLPAGIIPCRYGMPPMEVTS